MFQWKPEYALGIAQIDAQHRKLFEYFGELEQAMRQGQGRQVVGKLLSALTAYTREHFTHEEDLMRRAGYADLERHRSIHRTFVEHLKGFEQRHEQAEFSVTIDLAQSLSDWLRKHILGVDQQYAPHVKAAKVA